MQPKTSTKVETAIKSVVEGFLADVETNQVIRGICEDIQSGGFMILRSQAYQTYWDSRVLQDKNLSVKRERVATSSNISRSSKRLKEKNIIIEKDKVPMGWKESVSSTIKTKAVDKYTNRSYHDLEEGKKDIICNGFNSILDLSSNNEGGQKSLFTKQQWAYLQEKYKAKKNWKPLPSQIKTELTSIEEKAKTSVKEAYVECLNKQAEYAFQEEECYFEFYAHLLKLIHYDPKILIKDNDKKKSTTENDYVVKVWGPLMESVFRDARIKMKWGESVAEGSSMAKKNNTSSSNVEDCKHIIGDKVDMRICTTDNKDLLNVEFANHTGDAKYFSDHRKVLRESKVIGDSLWTSQFLKAKNARCVKPRCLQIAGTDGEIMESILIDDGLYVANKLGSIKLPSCALNMSDGRICLKRLLEVQRGAIFLSNLHDMLEKEKERAKKSMDLKRNQARSIDSDEEKENKENEVYKTSWTRGSWFPPSKKNDLPFNGHISPSLLVPPQDSVY